jgi:hypothetical protein
MNFYELELMTRWFATQENLSYDFSRPSFRELLNENQSGRKFPFMHVYNTNVRGSISTQPVDLIEWRLIATFYDKQTFHTDTTKINSSLENVVELSEQFLQYVKEFEKVNASNNIVANLKHFRMLDGSYVTDTYQGSDIMVESTVEVSFETNRNYTQCKYL